MIYHRSYFQMKKIAKHYFYKLKNMNNHKRCSEEIVYWSFLHSLSICWEFFFERGERKSDLHASSNFPTKSPPFLRRHQIGQLEIIVLRTRDCDLFYGRI